jgi:hypothetical protein
MVCIRAGRFSCTTVIIAAALIKAAIKQNFVTIIQGKQVTRTGHLTGSATEFYFHVLLIYFQNVVDRAFDGIIPGKPDMDFSCMAAAVVGISTIIFLQRYRKYPK